MIETKRVVRILTDLEGINEDLLNLYEDIQGNIDSRDSASRIQGPRDLAEYAEKLEAYEKVSADLRALIERIAKIDMRTYTVSQPSGGTSLKGLTPHAITEDFTFTHVAGFTLFGSSFLVSKWNRLYATLLQQLADRYPERFRQLPDTPPFNGDQRFKAITRSPDDHISPLALPYGLYCRGSMAVKDMFTNIRSLLAHFGIPEREMVVYLREEGDGE